MQRSTDRHVREFVAGFVDGDGCIRLVATSSRSHPRVVVKLAQSHDACEPPELVFVQRHYGGVIDGSKAPKNGWRREWTLEVCAEAEVVRMLGDLAAHCVIKASQARLALEYLNSGQKNAEYYGRLVTAEKRHGSDTVVPDDRLTDAYLAGLFAAEGSVGLYVRPGHKASSYSITTRISQHGCQPILEAIQRRLAVGTVGGGSLRLSGKQSTMFLANIAPFLVGQKLPQVELLLDFLARRPKDHKTRTAAQVQEIESVERELKRMKKL